MNDQSVRQSLCSSMFSSKQSFLNSQTLSRSSQAPPSPVLSHFFCNVRMLSLIFNASHKSNLFIPVVILIGLKSYFQYSSQIHCDICKLRWSICEPFSLGIILLAIHDYIIHGLLLLVTSARCLLIGCE